MDPEKKTDTSSPNIRTMRSDAAMYIKEKKISTLQIAASSYAQQAPQIANMSASLSLKTKIIFIGVIFLGMILMGGGLWWYLSSRTITHTRPAEILPPNAIIQTDGQNIISFKESSPGSVNILLNQVRSKTMRSGTMLYIPIKVERSGAPVFFITTQSLTNLLAWDPPSSLLENLLPIFNAYIYYGKESNDLVIIFKATNFEQAFSSMLTWEKTLAQNWRSFLNSNTAIALPKTFQDETIKNNDARILRKDDGTMIIGYTIFNKKYIIISTSREALGSVLERLIALPPQ